MLPPRQAADGTPSPEDAENQPEEFHKSFFRPRALYRPRVREAIGGAPSLRSSPAMHRSSSLPPLYGVSFSDAELLSFTLRACTPKRDLEDVCLSLIANFGSLAGVIQASPEILADHFNLSPSAIRCLKASNEAAKRLARADQTVRKRVDAVTDVLHQIRRNRPANDTEFCYCFYMDIKNQLLGFEMASDPSGGLSITSDRMIRNALLHHATGLLFVREISKGDLRLKDEHLTHLREIRALCTSLQMKLIDYLLISTEVFSFAREGLTKI